jgi:hypothetical protein
LVSCSQRPVSGAGASDGDAIDQRANILLGLEKQRGELVRTRRRTADLVDDGPTTTEVSKRMASSASRLPIAEFEGPTFHAVAVGEECRLAEILGDPRRRRDRWRSLDVRPRMSAASG